MKHSTCVLRSSNLYRRLKDHEMDERRKQKGHHSRQSSRDSTHARHSRQNSKDSTKATATSGKENSDEADHFGKNIEIYGTLPKKGSRKKTVNGLKKDDPVYKNFLDVQRKNSDLTDQLNETSLKNVDFPKSSSESYSKRKSQSEKGKEIVPPKSPVKKKDTTPKSDGKKQKQQVTTEKKNNVEFNCRDLLSPIPSQDKKPHKIKRKLMGNFMKRKNRSLPDLREDQTPMDCFLDDAIVQTPTTLQKPKKSSLPTEGSFASINRGFHKPHHPFIKKDQRPHLMKVSPPNVQITSEPKPINALPAIPKRTSELSSKVDCNKPSKIPFKSDSNLPTLPPQKCDIKLSPARSCLPKPSAIPVFAPQVVVSPTHLKPLEPHPAMKFERLDSEQLSDKEELPPPTNSFLAELQAKRKQVLCKSDQQQMALGEIKTSFVENKELSMLPKLALQAEGTSWLKELQSKQKKILDKQTEDLSKIRESAENAPVKFIDGKGMVNRENKPEDRRNLNTINRKLPSEPSSEVESSSNIVSKNNEATLSTVKNLASRFEKVLKLPNDIAVTATSTAETNPNQTISTKVSPVVADVSEKILQNGHPHYTLTRSISNSSIGVTFQLKSALKVKPLAPEHCTNPNSNKSYDLLDGITNHSTPIIATLQNNPTAISSTRLQDPPQYIQSPEINTKPLRPAIKPMVPNSHNQIHTVNSTSPNVDTVENSTKLFHLSNHTPLPNTTLPTSPSRLPAVPPSFIRPAGSLVTQSSNIVKVHPSDVSTTQGYVTSTNSSDISKTQGLPTSTQSSDMSRPPSQTTYPIKSALKQTSGLPSSEIRPIPETAKPIKSALKQTPSPTSLSPPGANPSRPMQPPDYATAMQRLELIRTSTNAEEESSPSVVKKSTKKVTFSDEVTLVACAEYVDEIDFSSNPLFERVYQQHLDSGKGEIPILSNAYITSPESEDQTDPSTRCNLCHNKQIVAPSTYCADCDFYLARFQQA